MPITEQKITDKMSREVGKTASEVFKLTGKTEITVVDNLGFIKQKFEIPNTITDVGKAVCAGQINGVTTAPMTALAIGIGSPSATALGSEITTLGGQRSAAAVSRVTGTVLNDTAQWTVLWSFTGGFAITEAGIFDNNVTGGNMLASQAFAAINVISGDTLQITWRVKFA